MTNPITELRDRVLGVREADLVLEELQAIAVELDMLAMGQG